MQPGEPLGHMAELRALCSVAAKRLNSPLNKYSEEYPSLTCAEYKDPGPPQPGQPFKFTVGESCDRIKEEFNFLQAQYHNLKLECEKLASEKIEIQRHYVMYYEMSYGLNVEMHKQVSFLFNFLKILCCFRRDDNSVVPIIHASLD
ncbi:Transducin-like enhancer protein 4 [Blattella germanica]|nr:Transducin-like enhancer protein 4 [Blattella germanica]